MDRKLGNRSLRLFTALGIAAGASAMPGRAIASEAGCAMTPSGNYGTIGLLTGAAKLFGAVALAAIAILPLNATPHRPE